jgi:hypothetical protein
MRTTIGSTRPAVEVGEVMRGGAKNRRHLNGGGEPTSGWRERGGRRRC